jgi:hypothetical protein
MSSLVAPDISGIPDTPNIRNISNTPRDSSSVDAACILEKAGLRACTVGDIVTMHYGSDHVLGELHVAIVDEYFRKASALLRMHGFCDTKLSLNIRDEFPTGDDKDLPVCCLLRPPCNTPVVLAPASFWHLDISPNTTYPIRNPPYRVPQFLAYLRGSSSSRCISSLTMSSTH